MRRKKSLRNFVTFTLMLVLVLSFNVSSLAAPVQITNHEVESNDDIGDENIINLNTTIVGKMNKSYDTDRFSFAGNGDTINYIFIKQSSDQAEYYTFIYDHQAGTYIKPLSQMIGDVEQFSFQSISGHTYTLLVHSAISSDIYYQFMFY